RRRVGDAEILPAHGIDLRPILELSNRAPLSAGLAPVIDHFLSGSAALLPGVAVGACVIDSTGGGPLISTLLPSGTTPPLGRDPSRLFPGFHDETVFELGDGARGSTFHLACERALLSPAQTELGARLTEAFGPMLRHARDLTRSMKQSKVLARPHAEMIQAEKLASVGQIVAGVVHELNNRLTSISAYTGCLRERAGAGALAGEDVHDDLARLRRIGEAA